jgi:biotin carboxyl carrier protein
MRVMSIMIALVVGTLGGTAAGVGGLALAQVNGWLPVEWFAGKPKPDDHGHEEPPADFVTLTPQAQANLGLDVRQITLTTFPRTVVVPARVVDLPGHCETVVTAPAAGVVTRIAVVPGESFTPGTTLFTIHIIGEDLYLGQKDLFKTTRDLQILKEEYQRIEAAVRTGSLPQTRLIDLDYQQRRLAASLDTARQDLVARGLTAEQIKAAAEGKFLTELTIVAPEPVHPHLHTVSANRGHRFDLDELKVHPGEKVQTGQALAVLSNHQFLDIEGHAFRDEVPLLREAAIQSWEVLAEFPDEKAATSFRGGAGTGSPGEATGDIGKPVPLTIRSLSNSLEGESQGFGFRLTLPNSYHGYDRDGKTYRVWRFRPGQRALVRVPVEQLKDVIVLPAAAVVHEAAEVYVFRQNGDGFQRLPVTVLYEDRNDVVLRNDGSINVGDYVARNAAVALNRALKAQAGGGEGGEHDEGGDHHHHHH